VNKTSPSKAKEGFGFWILGARVQKEPHIGWNSTSVEHCPFLVHRDFKDAFIAPECERIGEGLITGWTSREETFDKEVVKE
jgi:hypothetical protein